LGELKDRSVRMGKIDNPPSSSVWDQKRDNFHLVAAAASSLYQAKEDLGKIVVTEYHWSREEGEKIIVHSKLRISVRNGSKDVIYIQGGEWLSGSDGVPMFEPPQQRLKLQLNPGDKEVYELTVPSGSTFHTWIGLADHVKGEECLRRSGARRTGTMHLRVKIGDHAFTHALQF
jgi:hypothetical protein